MKRIFLFLMALCVFGVTQAQVGLMRSSGVYSVQKASQDLGPMTKNGNIYYYHGTPMKQADMVRFLNENCAEAYNYYRKQHKIEMAGWGIFASFTAISFVVGIPMGVVGDNNKGTAREEWNKKGQPGDLYDYSPYKTARNVTRAGVALSIVGASIAVAVGVPMIIAGNVQKKNAHKVYNTWCGYKELEENQAQATPLELKLISGSDGLGLALSF